MGKGGLWRCALLLAVLLAGCSGAAVEDASTQETDLFSGPPVLPGSYRLDEPFARVLEDGPHAPRAPEAVELRSALDGVRIQMALVRPDVAHRVPVILHASPYYGDLSPEGVLGDFTVRRLVENFVPHGYAVALLPVRGTADHGGCADFFGPRERADLDQVVTWLASQDWSSGAVGMVGLSYAGSAAWEVASLGHPNLKTIVPIAGVNDLHDLMYRNGSQEERGWGRFMISYYRKGTLDHNPATGTREADRTLEAAACPELPRSLAASAQATLATGGDPLGFWAERNMRPGVEANYRGSVFLVQGLRDWNVDPAHTYPWANALEAKGLVVKHLLGQWGHRWPDRPSEHDPAARMDFAQVLLRWFDRWLKNDTTVALGPRVQVQDSTLAWRTEDAWPPRDARILPLYLTPEGGLALQPASSSSRVAVGPAPTKHGELMTDDQDYDALCPACARFESEPFPEGLRIAGLPPVPLTVIPSAPHGHVTAWLHVLEGGTRTLVGWGQIDLRFAAGDGTPRPVTPGQPLVARLQLEPLDAVVPPGARLSLLLHQGSYGDHTPSLPTAPLLVEVGGEASHLQLPVVTRDGSTRFDPPGA